MHYSELTYTTTLSDGATVVELVPNGASHHVQFCDRWKYAELVYKARFQECMLQMNAIRRGLLCIIPEQALSLLTWHELQLRVCGEPTLNVQYLKRRTVYAPKKYDEDSEVVQNFWKAVESFSAEDRARFLQFAWARSRLPPEGDSDNTWRLKVNILEGASDDDLPTAETCFFNVNVPKYSSYDIMRQKIHLAVTYCSSITS